MAYSRLSNRRSALMNRRETSSNTASANIVSGDGSTSFSPSYNVGEIAESVSKDFTVVYDQEGNSLGEPQKIGSFGGINTSGKEQHSEDAKFLGICNKGNTSVEVMFKVRQHKKQILAAVTGVTSNTADNAVFTKTSHGFVDGDIVQLSGFSEATELNGISGAVVQSKTSNTFELAGISSDPAETTGGTVEQVSGENGTTTDIVIANNAGSFIKQPYLQMILHPGQFITLPHLRCILMNDNQTGTDSPVSASRGVEGSVAQTGASAIDDCTDGTGFVETTDWFGGSDTNGLVPGSICVQFFSGSYQEFGMTSRANGGARQSSTTNTGLTVNTAYRFRVTVDGSAHNIAFTTDTSDVTWGNGITGNGVLKKINDRFETGWQSGDFVIKPKVHIIDGDIRLSSGSRLNTSAILLADATSGAGTQLFGAGKIPAIGNVDAVVGSALETTSALKRSHFDTKHLLIDQGNGKGTRADGGSFEILGQTPYSPGASTLRLSSCPPYANFTITYNYDAALSGQSAGAEGTQNMITEIYARCVNKQADRGVIRLFYAN